MRRQQLVIMLKEPRPGRVKTRLGRDIGATAAAWWFRHQCAALLRRLDDPRWQLTLAVSPDREGRASRIWPPHLPRLPQGTGDLGHRMERVFRTAPPGPVLIIGADIPGVTSRHIDTAFRALGTHEAVLGPAPDGGYWLIGLKRSRPVPPALFENVRWSTPHAMEDTLRSLGPVRVAVTDVLHDIDTVADLDRLRSQPSPAPQSAACISRNRLAVRSNSKVPSPSR
ncbi:TIGR04282 family arsenosugar biosynthesis glycosyltransferase [Tropicimonas sp. TH_r6]|uniref:TIGR04282 family arsenosugar biosynthesis glycosyltransferase n=1 Tax=Tropicimonas sp. TH_r6 TaxID=3082085 RepID=UPI0029548153|nr:TIGR04282 family arsenosugar biosynthesis glycosyltransferase [Tropicimonas sp. TH_r6]MDV7143636.1 TIGR04282 family arsenosugar biosynthesis glycosyltransferase [Tropicimonas sp. TH_r6]